MTTIIALNTALCILCSTFQCVYVYIAIPIYIFIFIYLYSKSDRYQWISVNTSLIYRILSSSVYPLRPIEAELPISDGQQLEQVEQPPMMSPPHDGKSGRITWTFCFLKLGTEVVDLFVHNRAFFVKLSHIVWIEQWASQMHRWKPITWSCIPITIVYTSTCNLHTLETIVYAARNWRWYWHCCGTTELKCRES